MEFLLLPAIFAISFMWMWNRNEKARRGMKRAKITAGMDDAAFAEWRDQTKKRMSRADVAALLLTIMPLAALLPYAIHLCAWPALILAFKSNEAGRKANALAKQLGFSRGVDWLASKKRPAIESPSRIDEAVTLPTLMPTQPAMAARSSEYEVVIPEGKDLGEGYIGMIPNTQYSLLLRNHRSIRCDADVVIDGIPVGTWRIERNSETRIERPVHDTGHFTFFEVGSREAHFAGITTNPKNGLVSVAFKPEEERTSLASSGVSMPGATGLTGESLQRFTDVPRIIHDTERIFTIHIRLISMMPEIRSLGPRSTPIPPPV